MNLDKIRESYLKHNKLNKKEISYIEKEIKNTDINDLNKIMNLLHTIYLCKLYSLSKELIKFIDSENSIVRMNLMMYLLGLMNLKKYSQLAINLYKEDKDFGVQLIIVFNLGYIINGASNNLKKEIANIILSNLEIDDYFNLHKKAAYHSIVNALSLPLSQQVNFAEKFKVEYINKELVKLFKHKYINNKGIPTVLNSDYEFPEWQITRDENYSFFDEIIEERYFEELYDQGNDLLRRSMEIVTKQRVIEFSKKKMYNIPINASNMVIELKDSINSSIRVLEENCGTKTKIDSKNIEWKLKNNPLNIIKKISYCNIKEYDKEILNLLKEDNITRQQASIIYLLCYRKLHQYTEYILRIYYNTPKSSLKRIILLNLGYIIKKVDNKMQKEVAHALLNNLDEKVYERVSYFSIVNALDVPQHKQNIDELNLEILNKFKQKFLNENDNENKLIDEFKEKNLIESMLNKFNKINEYFKKIFNSKYRNSQYKKYLYYEELINIIEIIKGEIEQLNYALLNLELTHVEKALIEDENRILKRKLKEKEEKLKKYKNSGNEV